MEESPHGLTCTVESILNHCFTTNITPATKRNRKKKSASENRHPTDAAAEAAGAAATVTDVSVEAGAGADADAAADASSDCGLGESIEEVRLRFSQGCECQDQSCFRNINPESVYKHRLNIAELTRSEHDMYLMGVTMASLSNPQETARHTERKRLRTQYVYQVLLAKSTYKSTLVWPSSSFSLLTRLIRYWRPTQVDLIVAFQFLFPVINCKSILERWDATVDYLVTSQVDFNYISINISFSLPSSAIWVNHSIKSTAKSTCKSRNISFFEVSLMEYSSTLLHSVIQPKPDDDHHHFSFSFFKF